MNLADEGGVFFVGEVKVHGPVAYGAGGDADEAGGSERISYDQMIVNGEFLAKIGVCKNKPLVASRHVDMRIKYLPSSGLTSLAVPSSLQRPFGSPGAFSPSLIDTGAGRAAR